MVCKTWEDGPSACCSRSRGRPEVARDSHATHSRTTGLHTAPLLQLPSHPGCYLLFILQVGRDGRQEAEGHGLLNSNH